MPCHLPKEKHYYVMNKPQGYITACFDPNKPVVQDLLPSDLHDILHHVGRLDIDTTGLLLFTDDGIMDQALLSPKQKIKKTYFLYALGDFSRQKKAILKKGVLYSPQEPMSAPAYVKHVKKCFVSQIPQNIIDKKYKKIFHNPGCPAFSLTITIHEGRKHEIKRLMRSVGCYVVYLKRISFAGIQLDHHLQEGQIRLLSKNECKRLAKIRKKYVFSHKT